ncbi:MAG TPA: CBS domain-containing protein [Spirochaetia bacterium]|nr:CBS domain-containing protein [Spirochaetaceae bacterium]HPE88037.1 CBS domain-containing protein [Spirochaetales bacterium]HRW22924.1 CBS domain-containing protein [Spirochaetia bacterium]
MTVGNRMSRRLITVSADTAVPEAQALMRREKIHRLPVLNKDGKLVGIVTASDLRRASAPPATTLDIYELHYLISRLKVESVMTKNPITVREDLPVEEAARIMDDNRVAGLPVISDGELAGIITESDLFRLFIDLFGARHRGVRLTLLMPEKRGELAAIAAAIADAGGNLLSLVAFDGEDKETSYCTLKVEGVAKDALVALVEPLVARVMEARES